MPGRRVPIFPLNLVLFPGMPLPLHIFEPRYLEMVRICRERELPFGVCLIREGLEVGGPAAPCSVGTTAEVLSRNELPDGRLHLMTVGRERFRIERLFTDRPYLEADIGILPPEEEGVLGDLPERARDLGLRCLRALCTLTGTSRELQLPEDPLRLSYVLAAMLRAPLGQQQALLESNLVAERLAREVALLEEDVAAYEAAVERGARSVRRAHADPERLNPN